MNKVVIVRGYSGAGKTTFAKEFCTNNKFALLERDGYVFGLFKFKRGMEDKNFAFKLLLNNLKVLILEGYDVMVEGALINTREGEINYLKEIKNLCEKFDVELINFKLICSKEESYRRQKLRGHILSEKNFDAKVKEMDKVIIKNEITIDSTYKTEKKVYLEIEKRISGVD